MTKAPAQTKPPAFRPLRPTPRFRTLRSIGALLLREMTSTYGRSPGGYVWAILEPAAMLFMLSFAFSLLLRSPSLGNSFILFYSTGYLPFRLYQDVARKSSESVRYSRALLAYPTVTFLDALIARVILSVLTNTLVTYLILLGILSYLDTRVILDFVPMIEAMALAVLLGLGIGSFNCVLFGLFPLWKSLYNIATRPLFLMSAILYIVEDLPKYAADLIWYNPLVHITGLMRTGFYPFYDAAYVSVSYVATIGLVLLVLGLLMLRRYYRSLLLI